mmetsp:Transcript_647/g.1391  ORF Transcript_647/g.1391 Transcript_647/m.1391 type:complete len:113 (-) Transcript_647:33-371(-)
MLESTFLDLASRLVLAITAATTVTAAVTDVTAVPLVDSDRGSGGTCGDGARTDTVGTADTGTGDRGTCSVWSDQRWELLPQSGLLRVHVTGVLHDPSPTYPTYPSYPSYPSY